MKTITSFPESQTQSLKALENTASSRNTIDSLLSCNPILWRGCDMAGRGHHGQTTGYPRLDDILPGRGWPRNAIVEIVTPQWGMGELQLLVPLMRKTVNRGQWILWISPPYLLNSPALLQAGIDPGRILVVNLETSCQDALWSMEKALQEPGCGLVLAWQNWLPDKVVRRLQLAAEGGETLGVLLQHRASKYSQPSLRLQLKESCPADQAPSRGRNNRLSPTEITVLKARGNFRPRSVQLNLYQENFPFSLPCDHENS
ncbi:MAG: translesion DNA synthesis-associated protein ImuA [Gammaproteobacteria bacterium]|jgi:hypothetical protein